MVSFFFTKDFNEWYGIDSGGNGGGIFFNVREEIS